MEEGGRALLGSYPLSQRLTRKGCRVRAAPLVVFRPLAFTLLSRQYGQVRTTLPITCLILLGAGACAQSAPDKSAAKVTGYKVSAEGGVEGTITYRYDEQGRPVDGTPRAPSDGSTATVPGRPSGEARPTDPKTTPNLPIGGSAGMRTADGRTLPFQLSGQNGVKTVDESVDADSALRKLTKPNDLLGQRFETGQVDLTRDERFAIAGNVVSLDRWQGKSSALSARRSDIELADSLGADVRPKHLVEVKAIERPTSPWARRMATPAGWDARLGGSAELGDRRVNRDELSTMGTRANAFPRNPASIEQLSMQDINRYQFRRARSTEPGLPVGRPGSDNIETK